MSLFLKTHCLQNKTSLVWCLLIGCVVLSGCKPDDDESNNPVVYDDTPYVLEHGGLPSPFLPQDNQLTEQGVLLGRMLFYEPMLSGDNSQACADCHQQPDGFSDLERFSIGIRDLPGKRQAMPIFNMAWHRNGFFWDGRAERLRDQALMPIQDVLEMDETLDNVVAKLSAEKTYTDQFIRAFGTADVTSDKIALAMEQFMLSITSFNSKYDQFLVGEAILTESEERGRQLFFQEFNPFFPDQSGADCAHCHGGPNFDNNQYMNNGLDAEMAFTDLGRFEVTENPMDRAKFKVPSLRNIAVTPPYMHDGRFETLEETIEHYNSGVKMSSTVDPTIANIEMGLGLTDQDKEDLLRFLHTLTDDAFLDNEEYKSPF